MDLPHLMTASKAFEHTSHKVEKLRASDLDYMASKVEVAINSSILEGHYEAFVFITEHELPLIHTIDRSIKAKGYSTEVASRSSVRQKIGEALAPSGLRWDFVFIIEWAQ